MAPVKKYTFTADEKHRMLLEIAFYIYPVELTTDVSIMSYCSSIAQTRYKQFIPEAAEQGILTVVTLSDPSCSWRAPKTYYRLPLQKQMELLLEIMRDPTWFQNRDDFQYKRANQSLIQKFIVYGTVSAPQDYTCNQDYIDFVSKMAFYPKLRPYFDAQNAAVKWSCFLSAVDLYQSQELPETFDIEEAYVNNLQVSAELRFAMAASMYQLPYVLSGRWQDIPESFLKLDHPIAYKVQGVIALSQGQVSVAVKAFGDALRKLRQKCFDEAFYNVCYVSALIREDTLVANAKIDVLKRLRDIRENKEMLPVRLLIDYGCCEPQTGFPTGDYMSNLNEVSPSVYALSVIIARHYHVQKFDYQEDRFNDIVSKPHLKLLQLEASVDFDTFKPQAQALSTEIHALPLLPRFVYKEEWEKVLDHILGEQKVQAPAVVPLLPEPAPTARVIYLVSRLGELSPILQKSKDGVTWSTGRSIALKKFQKGIPEMSDLDYEVAQHVRSERNWYGPELYSLAGPGPMAVLAGHPLVFAESSPTTPVVITKDALQLTITKTPEGFVVEDNLGDNYPNSSLTLVVETDFIFHVVCLTSEQVELLRYLRKIKIFPEAAAERLKELIGYLSKSITIHSDLVASNSQAESVPADTRLTVQLQPLGKGIMAETYVKPLAGNPPYCKPGIGNVSVVGTVDGRPVQTQRDLATEKAHLEQLEDWLKSVIVEADQSYGDYYYFERPITCLSLLEVLQAHQDDVFVEWPQGVQYNLRGQVDFKDIQLKSKGSGQWFELEGDVRVNDEQVMSVGELLHKLRGSQGRFVQLSDGEFIAISERLRSQLSALESVTQSDKQGDRIPAIAAGFLSGLEECGVKVKKDKALRDLQKRISEAERKEFTVPKGIKAELRDYQVTGYQWMARLSEWGAGACLADDMGLGKTLQTITLLLARAAKGPSLVVTPTSVQLNWVSELNRFAPTLNPVVINDQRGERQALIEQAKPYDVVLTTYGVLAKESEALAAREWNVIALDEAHTIKNKETKMSKAAMELRGEARVMLTGTPLQNNLSELWTLFQFANPGLLGDFQSFTSRFLNPIEKQNDTECRRQLKQMVRPFILRRTKSEVLDELPEKTEVTLHVELSDRELALYESLRREAIANISDGQANAIQALAEITKLRQAACHPALVNPELQIPSSKTAAFCELVDELVHNHHRALVFSQFTSHLALIRQELDKLGIEYLYLDGSTPSAARNKLVKEFQEGRAPLFLISLKAGGLGLNLTAADYVIHLDPWWNPAIEDQASDRAYRMGQTRPVTVYRLIAAGTIEEKIIRLHQTKKSLADSLLEGSNRIQKISAAEILQLLQEK